MIQYQIQPLVPAQETTPSYMDDLLVGIVLFIFATVMAVIGYFIKEKLNALTEDQKDQLKAFNEFQKAQEQHREEQHKELNSKMDKQFAETYKKLGEISEAIAVNEQHKSQVNARLKKIEDFHIDFGKDLKDVNSRVLKLELKHE